MSFGADQKKLIESRAVVLCLIKEKDALEEEVRASSVSLTSAVNEWTAGAIDQATFAGKQKLPSLLLHLVSLSLACLDRL